MEKERMGAVDDLLGSSQLSGRSEQAPSQSTKSTMARCVGGLASCRKRLENLKCKLPGSSHSALLALRVV